MSQVKISGNASGTGVLTIAAPNTNTDRTITLPDKAGAIAVGAGTIVQVVQSVYSTQVVSTTNTLADTGLSATITPTSSSNKILVMFSQAGLQKNTSNTGVVLRLYRGTTQILDIATNTGFTNSTATNRVGTASSMKLDSPATTSAVTYKTQFSSVGGGTGVYVQVDNDDSVMTLLEVVA